MAETQLDSAEFDRTMDTVRILRRHYSTVAGAAEREMIAERMRGNIAEARRYKEILDRMEREHRQALDLVAERLTTPQRLRETRRALRGAADEAHRFTQELKDVRMSLDKLAEAAGFLTRLVAGLTQILV